MAVSVKLVAFNPSCASTSGGIARMWLFDNAAFTFTQAAYSPTVGYSPYTAVALTAGGTGASDVLYPVKFDRDEAEYTYKQSRKGKFSKYEHQWQFKLSNLSLALTNFNTLIDAANACEGIGLITQLISGLILVSGEALIGGNAIDVPMIVTMDGSSGTSGKLLDDFNGQDTIMKCNYKRGLIPYTGTLQSLIDLETI